MRDELYRQLCDASPDGIVVTDGDGRIVRVNRRAEAMFGYAAGEMDGLALEALLPSRYRAMHERHRGHFMAHASSRPMGTGLSLVGQRRDGSEFPIEVGLSPLAGGHAAAFVRDLSPTRRGREAFKQARYQEVVRRYTQEAFTTPDLEQVVQRTPELLVAAFDCDASELFMLSRDRREFRVRAAFGLPPAQAVEPAANDQSTLTGFVAASGVPLVVEDLQADPRWRDDPVSRAAGHRSALAVPLQLRDQTVGVLTVRSREVMRVSHDEVSLLTAVAHLLTVVLERQQGEERLAQGQKLEALGQLTGGVAHDFNNILTVVLGNLQLLDDLLQGEPRALKYAANAARAAQRGADLTRKLLTFARKQPLAPKAVPVGEFLRGWSELLARTFGESIQLSIRADDPDLVLLADPGLLETALLNLALNARDAMPQGGQLTVQAEAVTVAPDDPLDARELKPGPYVLISVTDTGHGMDQQVLRHVFEPFFTTKDGRGSGLGLAMVYGFVKQTGGGVAVYSEPDHGSTFKLYLPRAQPVAAAAAATTAGRPRGHERILVVEDDADVRLLATTFLEALGYAVVEVADAAQALALLRQDTAFDLVFSDVVLPGGTSGAQLARQALRERPGLRVLLASGYPRDALAGLDDEAGRIALLTKPYSRDDLARAVRKALDD